MLDNLTTEARNPASTHLDELTPLELVRLMNREDRGVADAVATQAEAIARAIEVIAERLKAYEQQTRPLADYYAKQGQLVHVNADLDVDAVTSQVLRVIERSRGADMKSPSWSA